MTFRDKVQLFFLSIEVANGDPEEDSGNTRDDGCDTVVPHQQGVSREGNEGLSESGRDGGHEEEDGHDQRTHILGGLGEGILKTGDGGEDLADGDQDVGSGLDPDIQLGDSQVSLVIQTLGCACTTRAFLVNLVLDNSGPDHSQSTSQESGSDPLQRAEVDTHAPESGVDEGVKDGDQDDQGERIEIAQNIVGEAVSVHSSSLGGQVVVELVVSEPVDGEPEEHSASLETTLDFICPLIIKVHPIGTNGLFAGLGIIPESGSVELPDGLDGVDAPFALSAEAPITDGTGEHGACGGSAGVLVASSNEDQGAEEEDDSWEGVGQPESNELLSVDHADLADQSSDVDEKVEVHVDPRCGMDGIDNNSLTRLEGDDKELGALVLFSNQWRDVGLEASSTETSNQKGEDEGSDGALLVNHAGNGRDNHQDMSKQCDSD